MKKFALIFISFLLIAITVSCTSNSMKSPTSILKFKNVNGAVNNYKTSLNIEIKKRFYIEKEDYDKIINHLENDLKIDAEGKDLVINYVFNNDQCNRNSADFSFIGEQSNKNIQIKNFNKIHPNLRFIFLREEGSEFAQSVLNDNRKIVDKDGFFRKNIFDRKTDCGNSILLLKDHSGIFIEKDLHIIGAQLYLDNNEGGSYEQ